MTMRTRLRVFRVLLVVVVASVGMAAIAALRSDFSRKTLVFAPQIHEISCCVGGFSTQLDSFNEFSQLRSYAHSEARGFFSVLYNSNLRQIPITPFVSLQSYLRSWFSPILVFFST